MGGVDVGHTGGQGTGANITFGPKFFEKSVGGWAGASFHDLTPVQGQILMALHELGHATAAKDANHPEGNADAYNEKVYKTGMK